jgi:hypothetical protein
MDMSQAQEDKQLRDANTKLRKLVVDLSLDKEGLQSVIRKNGCCAQLWSQPSSKGGTVLKTVSENWKGEMARNGVTCHLELTDANSWVLRRVLFWLYLQCCRSPATWLPNHLPKNKLVREQTSAPQRCKPQYRGGWRPAGRNAGIMSLIPY